MKDGVPGGLLRIEVGKAEGLAGQLNVLLAHRLHPFFELLEGRALISPDLARIASAHVSASSPVPEMQVEEECRVLSRLVADQVQALVIKGTALAAVIYRDLQRRIRSDMDILVRPNRLERARASLFSLGYRPTWAEPSAVPLKQEQWSGKVGGRDCCIDLHWDLRNDPVFHAVFDFDELAAHAVDLPVLGTGVRGLGHPHALLLSVMHWYANAPDDRALIWLLDSELLWTGMSRVGQEATMKLADERGLSGLLGHHLRLCREWMAADIAIEDIQSLEARGRQQRATGLIRASQSRWRSLRFELMSEPDLRSRLVRLRRTLLPSRAYMRQRFPEGSRLGLPGLYLRRLVRQFWRRD